jgi:hypothetical protein
MRQAEFQTTGSVAIFYINRVPKAEPSKVFVVPTIKVYDSYIS